MNNAALFSSARSDWTTPPSLFTRLNEEFHFDLDAAADSSNHLTERWLGPGSILEDALQCEWGACGKSIFCNPPYGKQMDKWLARGWYGRNDGATVVYLLPARTDTQWFHKFCRFHELRFIEGRLKFSGSPDCAPFPSMIVVMRPDEKVPWLALRAFR